MIEFKTYTNPGSRKINEDSFGCACYGESHCFVIADGLGGHGGGEVASQIAVDEICKMFASDGWSNSFFNNAINAAQNAIIAEQERQHTPSRMKTTVVILVIDQSKAYWAHVGDSRLYYFKGNQLKKRTLDHSVPQMLALSGEITDSEIRNHPDRSRLLRVLGVNGDKPRYDEEGPIKLHGKQYFLLCTDGFWELETEDDMQRLIGCSQTVDEWAEQQVALILKNGHGIDMDNLSCIAVRSQSTGLFGW